MGREPGKASWTAAQCGDCLSAQALGHAATPPWARAPALGFQRDVTGDWLSLSVAGSPLHQPLQSHPPPPPQPTPTPAHSFQSPRSSRLQMPLQQLYCFSREARLPPTPDHSHHDCSRLDEEGGWGWGGGCAATLHPSAPCLSMLWTMMLQHGPLGTVKCLVGTVGPSSNPLPWRSRCPPHAHMNVDHLKKQRNIFRKITKLHRNYTTLK